MSLDDFAYGLDWNLLKIFNEIAQAGGVTKAADRIPLKQSAISLALQRLETRIGVVLCTRGPRGFELTQEGVLLAELCAPMMRTVREIPNLANESVSAIHGSLIIGLISNFTSTALDLAISSFHGRFPNIELIISTMPSAQVPGAILRNEIDLGIAPSRILRPELRYRFLSNEVHRPYCGRGHALFGQSFEDPKHLKEERFILTGNDEPDELRAFRRQFGLGNKVSTVTEQLEEAKRFALLGLGPCFLPESYAQRDVETGDLWPLLPAEMMPVIGVFIIDNFDMPQHARRTILRESFYECLNEQD